MLAMTRKIGETIFIGQDIKVTILKLYRNYVKIGIEAPIEVPVHREEIYLELQNQEEEKREE